MEQHPKQGRLFVLFLIGIGGLPLDMEYEISFIISSYGTISVFHFDIFIFH